MSSYQIEQLKNDDRIAEGVANKHLTFDTIEKFSDELIANAATFTNLISSETSQNELRVLNEKLFRFERAFIDENKLPNQLQFKHVVFAPRWTFLNSN